MTLLEATQNCGEKWFRPVGMKSEAFTFSEGNIVRTDGYVFHRWVVTLTKEWILGEWEIVTPEQVRGERG